MGAPSQILDGLWQGGSEVFYDDAWFEGQGISHVVSACQTRCDRDGISVLHVSVRDHDNANITQHFRRVVEFIHAARCSGGMVYVHCSQGVSRSSAFVIAYVMAVTQRSADDALHFVCCKRSVAFPNIGFYRQLFTFEADGSRARALEWIASVSASCTDPAAQPEASELAARDACEVEQTLSDAAHNDVDVSAFKKHLRDEAEGAGAGSGGAAPLLSDGVILWQDEVAAREAVELCDAQSGVVLCTIEAGEHVQVLTRRGLDDLWDGVYHTHRGVFPRRRVRELDCADSEDEEYYQGSLGG